MTDDNYRMDARNFKNHRERVARAVAKIDNRPPKFNVLTYYKSRKSEFDAARVKELDRENMELIKKINLITRLGGNVDCWTKNVRYKSNLDDQRNENRRIKKSNEKLLKRINAASSVYPAAHLLKCYKEAKSKLIHLRDRESGKAAFSVPETSVDYSIVKNLSVLKSMDPSTRTRCFFDIAIKESGQNLGRIVFELYDDVVPRTAANFAELCRGTNGLSYNSTPFHRIVKGIWCQGGDVTKFNGVGGASIYGEKFPCENFDLCHVCPGILSMCNDEDGNDSRFNLTFRRLESQNGTNVVFGRVVSGFGNIYKIEEFGTKTGKPMKNIVVSDCGVLARKQRRESWRPKNA